MESPVLEPENIPPQTPLSLDKSPKRIRGLFDQIAPKYDLINHSLSFGIDYYWRWRTAEIIFSELHSEDFAGPFLDVCCGTADMSIALYHRAIRKWNSTDPSRDCNPEKTAEKNRIHGIDFSPEMLRRAREKIARIQAGEFIFLREGDALNLPFEDELFPAVCVAFGLRNEFDPERGIAEMVRVAKPGGVIAILDFDLPGIPGIGALYRFYLKKILPIFGRWISRNREGAYDYFSESVVRFEKGETLAQRLKNAGLIEVRFHRFTLGTVSLYLGRKH